MRTVLFLLFAVFAMVAADSSSDDRIIRTAILALNVTRIQAEDCIHKTGVTDNDVQTFLSIMPDTEITNSTDKRAVRRASCTIACLANIQGLMSGSKIELTQLHDWTEKTGIPQEYKTQFLEFENIKRHH
ncbi:uncharacterized protein LOC143181616 isoform X2 [Calliopsis andreniformis]|uniref:uncharacterized protein LOC143181616 isoform X2 n=1 Tax=Calliopsis andreniformis TaxID=337506 RepID=UPI003FCE5188